MNPHENKNLIKHYLKSSLAYQYSKCVSLIFSREKKIFFCKETTKINKIVAKSYSAYLQHETSLYSLPFMVGTMIFLVYWIYRTIVQIKIAKVLRQEMGLMENFKRNEKNVYICEFLENK